MRQRPTPSQQQIIDATGHLLVVAGPGSGKTTTVVQKIGTICQSPHARIVAVTFTRDGAQEMEARMRRDLGPQVLRHVKVGTFHSLTLRHLDECRVKPRVATPGQQRSFLNRCLEVLPADERAKAFQMFESAKCSLTRLAEVEELPWFRAYENMLSRNGLVDLYDVMRDTTIRMTRNELPTLACTHLIVDEAQDCDSIQFEWTRAHTRKGVITTLVGDDDQTIYEWRRAIGYPGMKKFAEDFSAGVVPLGENFRSLSAIVAAADRVISNNNPYRLRKELIARRGVGGAIHRVTAGSARAAAGKAAQLIRDHASELDVPGATCTHGVPTGSWAVLARSNYPLHAMQSELIKLGVRTFRPGASMWDTPYAQVFLSMAATVQTADPVGLDLAMLHFGIPSQISGQVIEKHRSNIGMLMDAGDDFSRFGASAGVLAAFFTKTSAWRKFARDGEIVDVIQRIERFVVESARENDAEVAATIAGAVSEALMRARGSLRNRVASIQMQNSKKEPENAVSLYTMHGAKGLEWQNVLLLGIDDDVIPGDIERLGQGAGVFANVASERRLFYVAMTRAKDRLWLFHTSGKGSRFLTELPSDVGRALSETAAG
jgi:DNA helicase-2/ATP-dependent DNA helicase PcrA